MPLDRAKFVKVLQMTSSEIDHEALAAVRMANKMLTEAGIGWTGLISGSRAPVTTGKQPEWVRPAPTMSITDALDYVETVGDPFDWQVLKREWYRRKYMAPSDQRKLFDEVYRLKKLNEREWEPD